VLFLVVAAGGTGFWAWELFPINVLLAEALGGDTDCKSVACGKRGFAPASVSLSFCSTDSVGFVAENNGFEGRDKVVGAGAKTLEADRGFSVD
jgi:hypothetical protein